MYRNSRPSSDQDLFSSENESSLYLYQNPNQDAFEIQKPLFDWGEFPSHSEQNQDGIFEIPSEFPQKERIQQESSATRQNYPSQVMYQNQSEHDTANMASLFDIEGESSPMEDTSQHSDLATDIVMNEKKRKRGPSFPPLTSHRRSKSLKMNENQQLASNPNSWLAHDTYNFSPDQIMDLHHQTAPIHDVKNPNNQKTHSKSKPEKHSKKSHSKLGALSNFFSTFLSRKKPESRSPPNPDDGCVSLSSKIDIYNVYFMENLLFIRKRKCLSLTVNVPFEIPPFSPTIEYKLKVKPRNSDQYVGVITHEFIEYEFDNQQVKDNVATIPQSHINQRERKLWIPFKLTKGTKDLAEGYKNTFKLRFTIKWSENLGVTVWFAYRCDSRGKEKKRTFQKISYFAGHDQVWFLKRDSQNPSSSHFHLQDNPATPILAMENRIVEEMELQHE